MKRCLQSCRSSYCIFTCVVDMRNMVYFNFFFCLLVPLVAMYIIYGHIFLTVRRQLRCIAMARRRDTDGARAVSGSLGTGTEDTRSTRDGAGTGSDTGMGARTDRERTGIGSLASLPETGIFTIASRAGPKLGELKGVKSKVRTRQDLRKAHSLFLVLFLFTVCWMPIHLINCVLLLCPQCGVPMPAILTSVLLSHANSAINPILYAYRMRSFRHTLTGMWRAPRRVQPKSQ